MRFAIAVLLLAVPFAVAEEPKSWKGEVVMPRKPAQEMTFQNLPKGEKTEKYELTGWYQVMVDDDVDDWLKIKDGKNEGWTPKSEWVLAADAIAYYSDKVNENARDIFYMRMRGICFQIKGEDDKAIRDFNECIRLYPNEPAYYTFRADSHVYKQEYDKAIKDYDEAIRLDPKYVYAHMKLGDVWLGKDYDKSIKHYSEVIRLDPSHTHALIWCGESWSKKKNYAKAIELLNEAIRLSPTLSHAWNFRGLARSLNGEPDQAIKDFSEAIRLSPNYSVAFCNRGNAWSDKREYDKAIQDYDEAIRIFPKFADHFSNRGNAWLKKKNFENAIKDYNEAIRLDPKDALPVGGRAIANGRSGKFDEAATDFDRAIKLDPMDWLQRDYAMFLASCPDAKYRDGVKALKLAISAIQKAGKDANWEYKATLAAAFAETGDFDAAVKEQKVALADMTMHADDRKEQEARLKLYEAKKPYRDE